MALTTNTKVWKIIIAIFIILTGCFALFFYFKSISLTILIGLALIIISEKLIHDYRHRMQKYDISKTSKRILGYTLLFFWLFVIIYLVGSSVNELSIAKALCFTTITATPTPWSTGFIL